MWHRGEGADEWTSGRGDEERREARRAPRAANLIGTVTATKEALQTKAKARAKARGKPDTATIRTHRSELPIQVGQLHTRRRGPRLVVGK